MGRLGAGGMGEVYRARDARLRRDVAVKILHPTHSTPEHVQRLTREARAAGALNHPNILAVFDVGTEGAVPYVVSELLEGESLRQRLDRGALSYHKALEYGIQIAQALAAAHDRGICHRDVKPGNVFITSDGRVKLLDFGLATLQTQNGPGDADDSTSSAITGLGLVCGTVGYMAPEQVVGQPADHRTDVFALGAVLYEMLTGARAFHRPSAVETMNAVLKEEPVSPLERNPALSPAAAATVRRCLEKNKEERFQSARDLAFHLQQLEQATTGVHPQPAPRPRLSRKLLVMGVALVVLAGTAWLTSRLLRTPPPTAFQQLTFLRGRVGGARFAATNVIYSQTQERGGPDVWLMVALDNPEARRRMASGAEVLAARPDKLALSFRRRSLRGVRFVGTLAEGVVGGGRAPHDVIPQDDVEAADWDPTGETLAVVRSPGAGETSRLEYPIGTLLYEAHAAIRNPRVSPDGQRVAFLEDRAGLGRGGRVVVVDRGRHRRELSRDWVSAVGLAWSPRGDEVWFTAADARANRALWAVDLKARLRLVLPAPVSLTLWDVAPDGRVLLTREDERLAVVGKPPREAVERDFSLSNDTGLAALSRDGGLLLLGDRSGAYLAPTDGSEPTPLGLKDLYRDDLSPDPDHAWVLATTLAGDRIVVAPTKGPGGTEPLDIDGLDAFSNIRWFPDGKRILFHARAADQQLRSYVMDLPDGPRRPLTDDGIVALSISPDGKQLAATGGGQGITLWPVGEGARRQVAGSLPGDRPEAWSADGRALWVFRRGELPAPVDLLDIDTGTRQPRWKLLPPDPAGVDSIDQFRVTPDGRSYFYSYRRVLSELYLVSGLR